MLVECATVSPISGMGVMRRRERIRLGLVLGNVQKSVGWWGIKDKTIKAQGRGGGRWRIIVVVGIHCRFFFLKKPNHLRENGVK